MIGLSRQLRPDRLELIANKVREPQDLDAVNALAGSAGVAVAAVVPYDERLLIAERRGTAPLDFDSDGAAVRAIDELAGRLLAGATSSG